MCMIGEYCEFEEDVVSHPEEKPLPQELLPLHNALQILFVWLRGNKEGRDGLVEMIVASGGTVSQLVLDLLKERDHSKHPWTLLNDPYALRTVAGKVARWLNGQNMSGLQAAEVLRSYKSE